MSFRVVSNGSTCCVDSARGLLLVGTAATGDRRNHVNFSAMSWCPVQARSPTSKIGPIEMTRTIGTG